VPMFFTRRKPDNIAGTNLLDAYAFALHPAATSCDDQCLAQRMCVPRRPSTGFKVTLAQRTRAGSGVSTKGSILTLPVNQSAGPFVELCEPTRFISICFSYFET
jgi:hypothetical protein